MSGLKSELLSKVPGILHGFGTYQEPFPSIGIDRARLSKWHQNHGSSNIEVLASDQQCGEVDALFTYQIEMPVAIVTADCVPILMAHKTGKSVAAIHAGWRGTRAHILTRLWETLSSRGEHPQDWIAAIGPSIGPCCYQVSSELAEDFAREFADRGPSLAVPRERILDLPAINASELKKIGLHEVDLIRACTYCSSDPLFHSFRREGKGTRQWSIISRVNGHNERKG